MATCPKCGKYDPKKQGILDHIERVHSDDIPDGMSVAQYYYSLHHGGRVNGICRVCGAETPWNEKAGKPKQLCGAKSCTEKVYSKAASNISRVHGTPHLAHIPEHQNKMINNKKISGVYKWTSDKSNAQKTYVGKYELALLEFLDTVMELSNEQVITPGPTIEYEFNGDKKLWYTDVWLPDFNLVIEVKDGEDNKNNHPGFAENRAKEKAKDEYMRRQKDYNYLKHTNKNMSQLITMLAAIRMENLGNHKNKNNWEPNIIINESVSASLEDSLKFYIGRTNTGLVFYAFDPTLEIIHYANGPEIKTTSKLALGKSSVYLFMYSGPYEHVEELFSFYRNPEKLQLDTTIIRSPSDLVLTMIQSIDVNKNILNFTDLIDNYCVIVGEIDDVSLYNHFSISMELVKNVQNEQAVYLMNTILETHMPDYSGTILEGVSIESNYLEYKYRPKNNI